MSRQGCVLLLIALMLVGCQKHLSPDKNKKTQASGQPAYTWAQWVKRETPRRAHFQVEYFRDGLPNMSRWRPRDFLSAKDFQGPHKDSCNLSHEKTVALEKAVKELDRIQGPVVPANRRDFMKTLPGQVSPDSPALRLVENYARQGDIFSQELLGQSCLPRLYDRHWVRPAEATEWLRKAAASGDPYAMTQLGECLFSSHDYFKENEDFASFQIDEGLYWLWRGAQYLDYRSLMLLARMPGEMAYEHKDHPELDVIEKYKWYELDDVSMALAGNEPTSGSLSKGVEVGVGWGDGLARSWGMSAAQVVAGRQAAKAWLLKYPQGITEKVTHQYSCPNPKAPPFDARILNKLLADLGLYFDVKAVRLKDIGPVKPPAWLPAKQSTEAPKL